MEDLSDRKFLEELIIEIGFMVERLNEFSNQIEDEGSIRLFEGNVRPSMMRLYHMMNSGRLYIETGK